MNELRGSTEWILSDSDSDAARAIVGKQDTGPNYSNGIPVARYKNKPGYLKLEIKPVTVIGLFGPSGSGKTTGMNTIASRAYDSGRGLVNLADTDLQFNNYKNNGGVAQSLVEAMGLYDGEQPHEISAKTLIPKFLYDELLSHEMITAPSFAETFSFGFHQVSKSELKSLLIRGLDRKQKQKMQNLLDRVEVNQDLTFDRLRTVLEEEMDIHENAKQPLLTNINNLENSNLISSRQSGETKDIIRYLNDGYIIGIGLKDMNLILSENDMWMAEFYARKVLEIIINARLNGELDIPLLGVLPEAHHLMPAGGGSELANKLKRNFTFYKRRTDFPFLLDTQSPYQLPGRDDEKDILGELDHVFIGRGEEGKTLDPKGLMKILKSMNIISNTQSSRAAAWQERVKDVQWREFLYVRPGMRSPSDAPVVEFLAPLVSNP